MPACSYCGQYSVLCSRGNCGIKGVNYNNDYRRLSDYDEQRGDGILLFLPFYFLAMVFVMYWYLAVGLFYLVMFLFAGAIDISKTCINFCIQYVSDDGYRFQIHNILLIFLRDCALIAMICLAIYVPYRLNNNVYIDMIRYINQTSIGNRIWTELSTLDNVTSIRTVCNTKGCW